VSDLRDLYQEVILDHGQRPRNFHAIEGASGDAEGVNPLCGDHIHVWVARDGDTIRDVAFTGDGCAISKASASLMTQAVKGHSAAEAERLFEGFHALITGRPVADGQELGKLAVFSGVAEFPVRVKCASLAWHTLRAALAGGGDAVTTE
jgi:nitrogen fixation protein NifU and related proteins